MADRGTLRISRELVNHPVLNGGPFDKRSAWLWLLSEASWAARRKTVNNIALDLVRGELAVSDRHLAKRWEWDKSRVRRFLDKLSAEHMIDRRIARDDLRRAGITVIRIVNFEHWQGKIPGANPDRAPTHPLLLETVAAQGLVDGQIQAPIHPRPTPELESDPRTDPPSDARNGGIKGLVDVSEIATDPSSDPPSDARPTQKHNQKNKRTILPFPSRKANGSTSTAARPDDAFKRWYAAYPKKVEPLDAQRAFASMKARGDVSFADLMTRTEKFAATERAKWEAGNDRKFTKAPAVWLDKGAYLNELDTEPTFGLTAAPVRDPRTFTDAEWAAAYNNFTKNRNGPRYGGRNRECRDASLRIICNAVAEPRHE
jgi:hypothetical protein